MLRTDDWDGRPRRLAAHPANHLHTPGLLAALTAPPGPADRAGTRDDSENAWESEGGRLREDLVAR
ncbi:hypothetical protein E1293_40350 [Actinomadura darangshiensis]|uniref:Uncharacterized protein n=1 Tax=Actinomadura darangshiensis TaxID=705336 RepID=A0A4R5A3Y8_9ACTN|nr:hypothetical protein [Actinomadura darangshiensis]TDD65384.1 hypothetical protein E1293_40350 [Actinomadura darangshiensis]